MTVDKGRVNVVEEQVVVVCFVWAYMSPDKTLWLLNISMYCSVLSEGRAKLSPSIQRTPKIEETLTDEAEIRDIMRKKLSMILIIIYYIESNKDNLR